MMNRIRVAGIFSILSGLLSILFSIRGVVGWMQVYYFWSFTTVKPDINPGGLPGVAYSIPAVGHTYEILLPWMVTGIFLLAIGLLLVILPEKGKKLPTKINDITEASE